MEHKTWSWCTDNCTYCDQELHQVRLPVSRCGDEEYYHTAGLSSRVGAGAAAVFESTEH